MQIIIKISKSGGEMKMFAEICKFMQIIILLNACAELIGTFQNEGSAFDFFGVFDEVAG